MKKYKPPALIAVCVFLLFLCVLMANNIVRYGRMCSEIERLTAELECISAQGATERDFVLPTEIPHPRHPAPRIQDKIFYFELDSFDNNGTASLQRGG